MLQGAQMAVIERAVRQSYAARGTLFKIGHDAPNARAGRCLAHDMISV